MKTIAEVKKQYPEYATLIGAVVRRIGKKSIKNVNRHGIDGGFNGFICYEETISFFRRYKKVIMSLVIEQAEDFGLGYLEMIKGFRCLKGYSETEIANALYERKSDDVVENAMAWYAAEEVCRWFEE